MCFGNDQALELSSSGSLVNRSPIRSTEGMATEEKKLYLLDAMALIYRAHFALIRSPRFTTDNRCTSAVFGVANTVLDIMAAGV